MGDVPWQGDAISLVEAFRRGDRSPAEELQATYEAIDKSNLNAFCFLDRDKALAAARVADVSLPFGGVPLGVKELER
ncbi:MAG: amidase, partial [Actinomycetota bacterium]